MRPENCSCIDVVFCLKIKPHLNINNKLNQQNYIVGTIKYIILLFIYLFILIYKFHNVFCFNVFVLSIFSQSLRPADES